MGAETRLETRRKNRHMTADELARSYLEKARKRRRVLEVLIEEDAYSDVVREAQELVELALKGMLRHLGMILPNGMTSGRSYCNSRSYFRKACDRSFPGSRKFRNGCAKNASLRSTETSISFRPRNTPVQTRKGRKPMPSSFCRGQSSSSRPVPDRSIHSHRGKVASLRFWRRNPSG